MLQYLRGDFVSFLDNLNKQQLKAVLCTDCHLRIIAGAGSGKTRVVTTRIAYLIDECHIYPNRILAITFTNKAAKEMKERVEAFLGDVAHAVTISTIHAFCVRLLREDIIALGYPRNFTIVDSDDQRSILRDAYKQLHVDVKSYSYHKVLGYISANKTNFVNVDTAMKQAGNWHSERVKAEIYAFYAKRLQEMYALDFDDLLIFTYRILCNHLKLRDKWQRRFQYIHVDEFQDVDALQYSIIQYLVSDTSYLCVVGDPDQTIYTWRGAQVDIIMNFQEDFPNSKNVVLNENYRSTKPILDAANALIKNNRKRIDKDLFTKSRNEDKIVHFTALDDYNEPVWVASKILTMHHNGVHYKDMAILYRSNYLSRGLEKALLDFQIPYRIYGGVRFYDRAEIKDALSYLRLLNSTEDTEDKELYKNLAIKRILNVPRRGIGNKTMEAIELAAQEANTNMYAIMKEKGFGSGKARLGIQEFLQVIESCRANMQNKSIDQILQAVLEKSGYINMLQEDKEIERLENIKELISDVANYVEANPEGSLQDYLQEISLYTDKEEGQDGSYVQLMTIHAAKGLEFDTVFVYSLCEGILPNERSINEGGGNALEEERRLAYVAFTRAKKQLFLSDSSGYSYVLDKIKTPSRFVGELPDECLQEVSVNTKHQRSYSPRDSDARNSYAKASSSSFAGAPNAIKDENSVVLPTKKKGKIRKGDLVCHDSFGQGVVLKLEDQLATIAFEQKFGIRKIKVPHPSLSKK